MLQRKRHKTESTHFQKVNEKRGIGIISKEKPKKTQFTENGYQGCNIICKLCIKIIIK